MRNIATPAYVDTKVSVVSADLAQAVQDIQTQVTATQQSVPSKVSDLTNDVGFITAAQIPTPPVIPTKVSDLTNDTGFITLAQVPSGGGSGGSYLGEGGDFPHVKDTTTITTTANLYTSVDDFSEKIILPFPFIFCGVDYGNDANGGVWICSNSFISFGASYTGYWVDYSNVGQLPRAVPNGLFLDAGDCGTITADAGGDATAYGVRIQGSSANGQQVNNRDITLIFKPDNSIIVNITKFDPVFQNSASVGHVECTGFTVGGVFTPLPLQLGENCQTIITDMHTGSPVVAQRTYIPQAIGSTFFFRSDTRTDMYIYTGNTINVSGWDVKNYQYGWEKMGASSAVYGNNVIPFVFSGVIDKRIIGKSRWIVPRAATIFSFYATCNTVGTTPTTVELWKNGVAIKSVTIPIGANISDITVALTIYNDYRETIKPFTDYITIQVVGTDTEDVTAFIGYDYV